MAFRLSFCLLSRALAESSLERAEDRLLCGLILLGEHDRLDDDLRVGVLGLPRRDPLSHVRDDDSGSSKLGSDPLGQLFIRRQRVLHVRLPAIGDRGAAKLDRHALVGRLPTALDVRHDLERLERAPPLRNRHRVPPLRERQPLIIEPGRLPSLEQQLLGLLASRLHRVVGGANDLGRDRARHRRILPLGLLRLRQRHRLLERSQIRRSRTHWAVRHPVEEGARHERLDLGRGDARRSVALGTANHPRATPVIPVHLALACARARRQLSTAARAAEDAGEKRPV